MSIVKRVSKRKIGITVERELWGRSAGRCEMCNKVLYRSSLTKEKVQTAEKAHIYAFSPLGTRGNDKGRDSTEINDISNLILLCPECHDLIDHDKKKKRYTVEVVQEIKRNHEERVEFVTGINPNRNYHVILLGNDIGSGTTVIKDEDAYDAMFIEKEFPQESHPITITTRTPYSDFESKYWTVEEDNVQTQYERKIKPLLTEEKDNAFALFGLAPMPILIKMGTLLTDQHNVEIFQLHRDTKSWKWQTSDLSNSLRFKINSPQKKGRKPVLVISTSGRILPERVTSILGDDCSIWEMTTDGEEPGNDIIKMKYDLESFRKCARSVLEEIRSSYEKPEEFLSIFPAMSVACSLAFGLCRMPKADLPWKIYDQNNNEHKFIETITIK